MNSTYMCLKRGQMLRVVPSQNSLLGYGALSLFQRIIEACSCASGSVFPEHWETVFARATCTKICANCVLWIWLGGVTKLNEGGGMSLKNKEESTVT